MFIDYVMATGSSDTGLMYSEARASDQVWWEAFGDFKLDQLIREAVVNNYDVIQAIARLNQASSLTQQAKSKVKLKPLVSEMLLCSIITPCFFLETRGKRRWFSTYMRQIRHCPGIFPQALGSLRL